LPRLRKHLELATWYLTDRGLGGYEDLIVYGLQARVIEAAEARSLRAVAARQPVGAARAYWEAFELRASIDRIFTKIVDGQAADRADLAVLNERLANVAARIRIVRNRPAYIWHDTGEALRFRISVRFFFVIPITYTCWSIYVLDALLDVSLHTLSRLNLAHMPLETRFRPLRKPIKYWR
jgi:hypothetical protein